MLWNLFFPNQSAEVRLSGHMYIVYIQVHRVVEGQKSARTEKCLQAECLVKVRLFKSLKKNSWVSEKNHTGCFSTCPRLCPIWSLCATTTTVSLKFLAFWKEIIYLWGQHSSSNSSELSPSVFPLRFVYSQNKIVLVGFSWSFWSCSWLLL